ncbi:MAG TPA: hypothetical protein VEB21_11565, partial [Terriglobales bacterium]|nr:hypothetical protein [Terriglobales bacterium]
VVAVDTLQRYFAEATPTAEVDLRLSLLALSSGRRGHRNPSLVLASARRTVLDQANFDAWCFYDRAFYVGKDINSPIKANLAASRPIRDLDDGQVERFFRRRALKLVARHLMPLMLFDRSGQAIERLARTLAVELTPAALADLQPLVQARSLFSERFETLIAAIEAHEICALLTAQLDGLMRNRWGYASRSEPTAYATPR